MLPRASSPYGVARPLAEMHLLPNLRPRETRPVPKGREQGRAVKADLSAFEPLAERLRRGDGDTGPQRAHFVPVAWGEVRLRSDSPVPQG